MNTYFVKYDGCDELGRVRISLSWTGDEGEFQWHEHLGTWLFGVRGFARDGKPTFLLLEDETDAEVWDMPTLQHLLNAATPPESWNLPTEVDKFLWRVVTSIKAISISSDIEPSFMDRP